MCMITGMKHGQRLHKVFSNILKCSIIVRGGIQPLDIVHRYLLSWRLWQPNLTECPRNRGKIRTLLFGPAMIFSALEIAIQDNLDNLPSTINNFYPPWRLRLREILKVIQNPSQKFIPLPNSIFSERIIECVNNQFEIIKKIVEVEDDKTRIEDNPILKIAYREIYSHISDAKDIFHDQLKDSIVKSHDLYTKLPHLIKRIDLGIPPNAHEENIDEREPATLIEIINAVWFHKITWEDRVFDEKGVFNEDIIMKRDRMNRLTLKEIGRAHLEDDYRKK